MRLPVRNLISATLFAFVAALAWPARAGVLGVSIDDGVLVDVNPATGMTSNPRSTGLTGVVGISFDSGGTLYGLTAFLGTPNGNSLYTINPTTGASSLVGSMNLMIVEGDLAFSPSGTLYGLAALEEDLKSEQLFTINKATGAGTIVGLVGKGDLSAMAFSPTGTLYVLDTTDPQTPGTTKLLTVNPATAAILTSVDTNTFLGDVSGMYYDTNTNHLIVADGDDGAKDELFTLDPVSGTMTAIGSTTAAAPRGLAGLAVTAVPLPPAALAAMPLLAMLIVARRAKTA